MVASLTGLEAWHVSEGPTGLETCEGYVGKGLLRCDELQLSLLLASRLHAQLCRLRPVECSTLAPAAAHARVGV